MHVSTYYDCFIEDICFIQFLKKYKQTKTSICVVIDQHKVFVNNNVQNIIKLLISVLGIVSSYPCTLYWNKIWIFYMFYGAAIGVSAALIEWKTQSVSRANITLQFPSKLQCSKNCKENSFKQEFATKCLESEECFIYLQLNAWHSWNTFLHVLARNLVAICHLHGIVGRNLVTDFSVCQREQYPV